jgi:hypothetical protein
MKKKMAKTHNIKKKLKKREVGIAPILKLEQMYLQYLVPMPITQWRQVENLEQPSLLKRVASKTGYSSVG